MWQVGWSELLPGWAGITPGSSALSFGCIQQPIFTLVDLSHISVSSFPHASFSPICITSTEDVQAKRALLIRTSHTFLLHHAARHLHLPPPHRRHPQFSSLLSLPKRLGCAGLSTAPGPTRSLHLNCLSSFWATSNFLLCVCVMVPVMCNIS